MIESLIAILLASLGFSIIALIISVFVLIRIRRKKEKDPDAKKRIGFK